MWHSLATMYSAPTVGPAGILAIARGDHNLPDRAMPKLLAPFRKGCPTKLLPRHVAIVVDVVPTGSWAESEDTLVAFWFSPKTEVNKPDEVVVQNFDDALLSAALRCEGCTPHGQSGFSSRPIRRGFGQRINADRRRTFLGFGGKDVLRTGSRIGVLALDEVWPEVLAIERRGIVARGAPEGVEPTCTPYRQSSVYQVLTKL